MTIATHVTTATAIGAWMLHAPSAQRALSCSVSEGLVVLADSAECIIRPSRRVIAGTLGVLCGGLSRVNRTCSARAQYHTLSPFAVARNLIRVSCIVSTLIVALAHAA